jgi:hypothetical protein
LDDLDQVTVLQVSHRNEFVVVLCFIPSAISATSF